MFVFSITSCPRTGTSWATLITQTTIHLEYWSLLNRIDTGRSDDRFIREEFWCANARDACGRLWWFRDSVSRHAKAISKELEQFIPEDDTMLRLAESVEHGLRLMVNSASSDDRFDTDSCWAYDTFRADVFREWCRLKIPRRRTNNAIHPSRGSAAS